MQSDEKLIAGCLKGDRKAQKDLYLKFKSSMFGLCMRYARDRAEAEDLLQEGFLKVYSDLYQYKPTGPLGGWIRRVMINVALQHIRKKKHLFSDIPLENLANDFQTTEDIFGEFRAKALVGMIQQLPVGFKTVFNLYVIEGYSHAEISQKLNISVNTSKSQLSRAKAQLRKMLENTMIK